MGIGASDIFMLKDLVEHVQYHSEEYGDDFKTFFKKHYGSLKAEHQKKHKKEKSDHEKLPFQHNSHNHLMTGVILITYEGPLKKPGVLSKGNSNFHYRNLYSSIFRRFLGEKVIF